MIRPDDPNVRTHLMTARRLSPRRQRRRSPRLGPGGECPSNRRELLNGNGFYRFKIGDFGRLSFGWLW